MYNLIVPNLTVQEWLVPLVKGIWNKEENKPASTSAAKRWISGGAVHVNGAPITLGDFVDFPVFSVVIFPKSKGKVTIW